MRDDVRDRELAAVLDQAVRGIEPPPDARLPEIHRRGIRRRGVRWIAIAFALAVFAGSIGWAALRIKPAGVSPASLDTSTWNTYRDSRDNWTMRYPPQWHLQVINPGSSITEEGALVTNLGHDLHHPSSGTNLWDLRGAPRSLVIVKLATPNEGVFPENPVRRTPLSLRGAFRDPAVPEYGVPRSFALPIRTPGGTRLWLSAIIGPDASLRDRAVVHRIVASIRFQGGLIRGHTLPRLGNCPSVQEVAANFSQLARASVVRGDIDGDGRADAAWVVDVPRFPDTCSRFVVVREASGKRLAARLPEWWSPQMPKVATLAQIDIAQGSDVVATFYAGGFSRQIAIFSIRGGKLVPLRLPEMFLIADAPREAANLDCAGPPGGAQVVWTITGSQRQDTTLVLRRFYRLIGTRFQLEPRRTERLRVPTPDIGTARMARLAPEMADLKVVFPSCGVR